MRLVRLIFRAFGWLLTPFMAWAASFFGGVAGMMLATRIRDPFTGILVAVVCSGITGFAGLLLWLRLLRKSPEIREALAVAADGTPDIMLGQPILEHGHDEHREHDAEPAEPQAPSAP